jgi:DNA-nicking Smr family endonuclease
MARKKKTKSVTSKQLNNPFGSLKGFAVSAGEQHIPSAPAKIPADEPLPAAEEVDFDAQMERFGVQRLNVEEPATDQDRGGQSPEVKPGARDCDQDVFLTAMNNLNVSFADAYSTEESLPSPAPRRMKQLRRGTLVPEATLDLHGFARQDVEARLTSFIANARYHGWQVLLVITGKGLHSPEGEGVLRSEVENFLQRSGNDQVAEWGRAPRQYGGDGAIVLFLRRLQD